ncbi:MAG TPA: amidohydrolase [Vicinamibacteria bacterium]|nr:amidohydrolase [Vicinamibacteria bacterium]
MRTRLRPGFLAALGIWGVAFAAEALGAQPADLILSGGKVFTADATAPFAEAVAISGGRILYVGSVEGAARFRGPKTRFIDLRGRLCLPGFNDAHIHLMSGATSLARIDLSEDTSSFAIEAHIARDAEAHPDSAWVLGFGWVYSAFPGGLPAKGELDEAVKDRPAYMESYDGHTGWANGKALALAGITRTTPDPPRGAIVHDPAGEPTGVLKEEATRLVLAKVPKPFPGAQYALLLKALALLASEGITSVQDARDDEVSLDDEIPLFERALREGRLSLRIRAAVLMTPGHVREAIEEARRLKRSHTNPRLQFGTLKGFVDGVVESHTAALLAPYADNPALGAGETRWAPEALKEAVVDADAQGLQVYLHAIGDRAVRTALDAYEAALRAHGPRDRRGRIEHVETIDPVDIPRFQKLGVIASMQPLHASPVPNTLDIWAGNLGPERASRGFAWARLEHAGARLAFGSDWPVVTADVFQGLYCALTRKTPAGSPPGGWFPEQSVGLESALRHYTADGAYASFEEQQKGTLAAGRLADVIVVSEDLFAEPPEALLKARVLLTLVEGQEVFRAPGF